MLVKCIVIDNDDEYNLSQSNNNMSLINTLQFLKQINL